MQPHRIFLAIVLAALALVAAALAPQIIAAHAQQPSKCGAYAVGKRADGSVWAGVAPRMWVDREGWWRVCQTWVPDGGDPEMPEPPPKKGCLGRETFERWQGPPGTQCSSQPAGAYSGTMSKLREAKHDDKQLLLHGGVDGRGMLLMQCVQGEWRVYGSTCSVPGQSDTTVTE